MKVAILEVNIGDSISVRSRVDEVLSLVNNALSFNVDLILLPELWMSSAHSLSRPSNILESLRVEVLKTLQTISKERGIVIHAGSFVVEQEGVWNRAIVYCCGKELFYDKRRVFGFGVGESQLVKSGSKPLLFDFKGFTLSCFTCYDLRFPELFRESLQYGMTISVVSAAWPESRIDHWFALLKARAIENQCFVIACNGLGLQGTVKLPGGSIVIGPNGREIQMQRSTQGLLTAEIDPEFLDFVRRDFPVLADIQWPVG